MSQKVNLDALIPREDFETDEKESNAIGKQKDSFVANDLRHGEFFYSYLRKPDFQRETSELTFPPFMDKLKVEWGSN
jgi:hypothetical protein